MSDVLVAMPAPAGTGGAAVPGMMLAATLGMFSDEVLVMELRRRGWAVERPRETAWTSPGALSRRVGFNGNYIASCLDRGIPVPGLEIDRGPKGRIRSVRPTAVFFEWAQNRLERAKGTGRLEE